jgi:alpha-beta hydrolase superfamily lysophospholipase
MTPTLTSLQQLAAHLPPLDFTLRSDQRDWLASAPVQAYLDFYGFNFAAEGLCSQHHFGKFSAAGFEVSGHIWQPVASAEQPQPRGTVFFIHGFTDSVGLMQHALRFLLQQQWAVVAFDLPGHGLSTGTQASIDSFDQYRDVLLQCLEHCQQALPKPWHGVGQSTGGSVWLNYLGYVNGVSLVSDDQPLQADIDKIVLLAPLVRPQGWGVSQWFFPLVSRLTAQLKRKFNLSSHDQAYLDFVRHRDPLQSRITPLRWAAAMSEWIHDFRRLPVSARALLVIQGDEDTTVDFKYNLAMIKTKFPNAEVAMITGARHQLVNETEAYRQRVFARMEEWLGD